MHIVSVGTGSAVYRDGSIKHKGPQQQKNFNGYLKGDFSMKAQLCFDFIKEWIKNNNTDPVKASTELHIDQFKGLKGINRSEWIDKSLSLLPLITELNKEADSEKVVILAIHLKEVEAPLNKEMISQINPVLELHAMTPPSFYILNKNSKTLTKEGYLKYPIQIHFENLDMEHECYYSEYKFTDEFFPDEVEYTRAIYVLAKGD